MQTKQVSTLSIIIFSVNELNNSIKKSSYWIKNMPTER
jgi:hypothetical protein